MGQERDDTNKPKRRSVKRILLKMFVGGAVLGVLGYFLVNSFINSYTVDRALFGDGACSIAEEITTLNLYIRRASV
jgi:multisubunit Na+/H+ antiporter MnhB subunit